MKKKNRMSFTEQQAEKFEKAANELQKKLGYPFIRHIANSAAVIRHPQLQMDMVTVGYWVIWSG